MKRDLTKTTKIPEGVAVEVQGIGGKTIIAKGSQGELKRTFKFKKILIEKKENGVVLSCKKASKKEKRMISTISSHIANMIHGVNEKFEYELKVCNSHFPMTVEYKTGDKIAIIKNFLGEKIPRKVKIQNGAEVDVKKDIITVKSSNKEIAGQTAANFEKATFVSLRDRRVFQDGIFITKKPGREI